MTQPTTQPMAQPMAQPMTQPLLPRVQAVDSNRRVAISEALSLHRRGRPSMLHVDTEAHTSEAETGGS